MLFNPAGKPVRGDEDTNKLPSQKFPKNKKPAKKAGLFIHVHGL